MACLTSSRAAVKNIFIYTDEEKGLYVMRLYKDGSFQDVAVDDLVPVRYHPTGYRLAFAKAPRQQAWICMLEKAYAKAWGSLNRGFGNGFSRDLKKVFPGCENPGLVIPKHKFSHERKEHFHDSENPCLQNPC